MVRYITIDEHALDQRLDNFLIKQLKGVPKSHIYRLVRKGEVRVNKGRKSADYKLKAADVVRIPPLKQSGSSQPAVPSSSLKQLLVQAIIYEDEGLLAINKPTGVACHGGSGIRLGIIETLRSEFGTKLELIHRLDKDTSGCLLLAKKRSVLRALQHQWRTGEVNKTYICLLHKHWAKKTHIVDLPLKKNITLSGERMVSVDYKTGKNARSEFKVIQNFRCKTLSAALAEVRITTGRTHQIRVHAQSVLHPLAGDRKYGDPSFNKALTVMGLKRLFLHAQSLAFINPLFNIHQNIRANMPSELNRLLKTMSE